MNFCGHCTHAVQVVIPCVWLPCAHIFRCVSYSSYPLVSTVPFTHFHSPSVWTSLSPIQYPVMCQALWLGPILFKTLLINSWACKHKQNRKIALSRVPVSTVSKHAEVCALLYSRGFTKWWYLHSRHHMDTQKGFVGNYFFPLTWLIK